MRFAALRAKPAAQGRRPFFSLPSTYEPGCALAPTLARRTGLLSSAPAGLVLGAANCHGSDFHSSWRLGILAICCLPIANCSPLRIKIVLFVPNPCLQKNRET
jgi:hypothetical protein